jgi:hypothetical protein
MDRPGGVLVGGLKPVGYLLLAYFLENIELLKEPAVWVNLKDMEVTLMTYVRHKSLPLNLTSGHMKAALLMLEGGYVTIERDSQEAGRNLEHPFKIRVNPSGKTLFEELAQEVGYSIKNIINKT